MVLAVLLLFGGTVAIWGQGNVRSLDKDQLFALVEQNSKRLQAQRTQEQVAQQGVDVAKSQRLPDIGATVTASYLGNALMTNRHFGDAMGLHSPHFGNSFSLEAKQTVYAGGAIHTGIRIAELTAEQARTGTLQRREEERFLALGQYLDIAKIDNRIQVVEQNQRLTQKLIGDVKARHDQGMALKNDVTRYELQMQNLQLDLTKLKDNRSILNHQLCNALGIGDVYIVPTENLTSAQWGREGETYWQQTATSEAPVLQLSRLSSQVARQQVKMVRSELLPKVAFVAADQLNGPITYELPPINRNLNIWYVGVGVNYSLSSLFKSNKKLRQARTAVLLTQKEHEVAAEQVNNQIQQAYTDYEQSYVELQTQLKKVELARQNYQVVNDRYLNQLALVTDMIDASNVKLDAELGEADARINVAYAYYRLMYIAGKL